MTASSSTLRGRPRTTVVVSEVTFETTPFRFVNVPWAHGYSQPTSRISGPDRVGPGPGLHGHERVLRTGRPRRVRRHHQPGARPRRHVPRYGRRLRTPHQ